MSDAASTRQPADGARVTVITAAYGRPDALRAAIRSVRSQTIADWRMLVIGDCCSGEVAAVAEAQQDSRIRFINLPRRFGEQSGPNSVGMALADTPFLALLSHDEVFLPDHLERALETLEASGAAFCFAGCAKADALTRAEGGRMRPKFQPGSTFLRGLAGSFRGVAFEPCSAWVFRREVYENVGEWRPRAQLFRPPVNDWAMRAWRSGVSAINQPLVSVLQIVTHRQHPGEKPLYEVAETGHDWLEWAVDRFDADTLREIVEADIRETAHESTAYAERGHREAQVGAARGVSRKGIRKRLRGIEKKLLINRWTERLYYWLGLDTFALFSRIQGIRRGDDLREALRERVGEDAPAPPDLAELITWARKNV